MKERLQDNSHIAREIQQLRDENQKLLVSLKEKSLKIKEFEERLFEQSRSFSILNKYSINLANQSDEDIYSFIVNQFKSIFKVKEVWISIYDDKNRELVLKGTTLSEDDNAEIVKRLGRNILGFKTPITEENYRTMVDMGIGEPSSLYEISFKQMPQLISSALERLFAIGWFQGVTLTDKGHLYGGLVVAGFRGQNQLAKEELRTFTEITSNVLRRRQIEKELLQSEAKFREFSDLLPQLVFETDVEGKLTFINEFGLNMLGYLRDQLQDGVDVFNLIDHQSKDAVMEGFQKTLKGSGPIPREYRVIRKDGKLVPILMHAVLYSENGIPKGIRGTGVDVTELREAQEMLSVEKNLLKALIDNLPDRIYAKDTSSRFIICNDALIKRMGKNSFEEIIGKSEAELLESEKAMEYLADEQKIINTGIPLINKEETILFTSGQIRWSLSTKIPLRNSHGEIIGIVGIGRDITDLKMAQLEADEKNDQLKKIIADRDKFFSIIAHDLKSPFNYFLGFTELISDQVESMPKEKIREITANMRKSALNLYTLLENLLEWSKMQRGQIEFNPHEFGLFEKVKESINLVSGPALKKDIRINLEISEKLYVIADTHMFDAIIRNLVSNAIKFSYRGSNILVSGIQMNGGQVEIKVSDTGIGMDAETLKNLFFQNDIVRRKGTDNEPSTGLGLMLCKEFVEKHGSKILVTSEEGKGSSFTFALMGLIRS